MERPGVHQVEENSAEQGKMEESGYEIICGAPTTIAVKGWMMMMRWSVSSWVRWGVSITRPKLESVSSFGAWGVSLTRPEMEPVWSLVVSGMSVTRPFLKRVSWFSYRRRDGISHVVRWVGGLF